MQTRSSLHCVFLPFETFAVFCDCNPSPDPLAPGRIRARMPQRRDFRKKQKKKQVSGCKFQGLLQGQRVLQANTFLMQKRKAAGIRSLRRRVEEAPQCPPARPVPSRARRGKVSQRKHAKPLWNSSNVPASQHESWRWGGAVGLAHRRCGASQGRKGEGCMQRRQSRCPELPGTPGHCLWLSPPAAASLPSCARDSPDRNRRRPGKEAATPLGRAARSCDICEPPARGSESTAGPPGRLVLRDTQP